MHEGKCFPQKTRNNVLANPNPNPPLYFQIGLRYKDELQKKADVENDFIVTKKVL